MSGKKIVYILTRSIIFFLIIFCFSSVYAIPISEPEFIFLSDIHGRGLWAKYITDNDAFNWNGQLGIDWDIFRYKNCCGYLLVNIETIIKKNGSDFNFDPDYIRYALEPGFRIEGKKCNFLLIYHHICRHDVDRFDKSTEKWNILGLRLESKKYKPEEFSSQIEYIWRPYSEVSFGKYVSRTDVSYDWSGVLNVGFNVLKYKNLLFYVENTTHFVTQEKDRPSGKKYFIDTIIESGVNIYDKKGVTSLFCQYRHEHDVDIYNGTTENWELAGVRYKW